MRLLRMLPVVSVAALVAETDLVADIDRIRLPVEVSQTELLARVDDLTASAANRVFAAFGFRPALNIL